MIDAKTLDRAFEDAIRQNPKLKALYQRIRDGTFEDCQRFAIEMGKVLSKTFKEHIIMAELPDGRITWQIGNELIKPELVKGYEYTSSYFSQIQETFNKKHRLNIKGALPDSPDDRIKGILDKLTEAEYEKVGWILEDPAYLQNLFESAVDTGIKNNVGMFAQAGIRATITREVDGKACPWCMNLAGVYEYPVDTEIYRRHRDCHCTVTYSIGDYRQNAHTKKEWYGDAEEAKRRELSVLNTVLSPEKAKAIERFLLTNR